MEKIVLNSEYDIGAYYRGKIIEHAINIEFRIDTIIGIFLSSNKTQRTHDILEIFDIVESVGLYGKYRILQYIMKKYFSNYLKNQKDLFKNIDELIRVRNIVAHKKPGIFDQEVSKFSWAKTTKNSVSTGTFVIDKKAYDDYKNLSHKVMPVLIDINFMVQDIDLKKINNIS